MFHRHIQTFAQSTDQEFQEVADCRLEGHQAKARVCAQINHTVDQTTDGANLLQKCAEVSAITFKKGPDEHVGQLGGKTADDFSLLDVSRNRFSSPLCHNCSVQFVQSPDYRQIIVVADVLLQKFGYQTDA